MTRYVTIYFYGWRCAAAVLAAGIAPPASAAGEVQEIPAPSPAPKAEKAGPEYTAVMASFPQELEAIEDTMVPDHSQLHTTRINGIEFKAAEVGGRRYLFFLTGMSLVNAATSTQFALDHFNIGAVLFTGIAGRDQPGVPPGRRGGAGALGVPFRGGVLQRVNSGQVQRRRRSSSRNTRTSA